MWGVNPKGVGTHLLFGKMFPENCTKLRKLDQDGGDSLDLSLVRQKMRIIDDWTEGVRNSVDPVRLF